MQRRPGCWQHLCSNYYKMNQNDVMTLEEMRPQMEFFIEHGICKNVNFDPLIEIYKRYCDEKFPRLRYYEIGHAELDMLQRAMKALYRYFDDWKLNNQR